MRSWNSPPLTYGNRASISSRFVLRGSGGFEDSEEPLDERPYVGPVFAGAGLEELLEQALVPYAGVVGEQHEHEAHKEHLEVVSAIPGVF